ncbi:SCO0930 family lipoprotein [Streptomyces sp. NBC_00053]|uniref:SCO0930 family lipoprotein n=1 Tax=unclassified Streptomyces TaxID=2593676 RepID=UPI002254E264|nr:MULTISPECIES: SCO0930 family lipoprotein [unclassified Streptomyces]MCX5499246.1 SCO0930 family lipoprotein [Streptomyces sp. NBC_00052]MCX5552219.1 SCO0930 family lipoprotein [Streptomyces sp. NBC_00051]WSC31430.1 SCO0930 family lipoprotein [Streptomyces sp. NBC_01768]
MRKFTYVPVVFTVAAVMLTAACTSSQGTAATTTGSAGRAAETGNGAQPSQAGRLSVWKSRQLGPVVTDGAGFTLYRFDKDTAKPPASNCSGDCAAAWPPVLADGAKAGRGVDPGLLGSVKRADGTRQLTLAGWPLYRYAQDTAPRQTRGQGVGGTWFSAAPDGTKAKEQAQEAPSEPNDLPALSTVVDKERGTIVRDGKGRTLYRFTKDTAWPMKSNCLGACLEMWKPAGLVDKKNIKGIAPKLLSPYTRSDGSKQLSIDCWPLYWYTGDEKPGDANGHGVNGTWFTVRPNGKLAK